MRKSLCFWLDKNEILNRKLQLENQIYFFYSKYNFKLTPCPRWATWSGNQFFFPPISSFFVIKYHSKILGNVRENNKIRLSASFGWKFRKKNFPKKLNMDNFCRLSHFRTKWDIDLKLVEIEWKTIKRVYLLLNIYRHFQFYFINVFPTFFRFFSTLNFKRGQKKYRSQDWFGYVAHLGHDLKGM